MSLLNHVNLFKLLTVVFVGETGGRFSGETQTFVRQGQDSLHSKAAARSRPPVFVVPMEFLPVPGGCQGLRVLGDAPSVSDVLGDFCRAPIAASIATSNTLHVNTRTVIPSDARDPS